MSIQGGKMTLKAVLAKETYIAQELLKSLIRPLVMREGGIYLVRLTGEIKVENISGNKGRVWFGNPTLDKGAITILKKV
jgi:hypothetical protein